MSNQSDDQDSGPGSVDGKPAESPPDSEADGVGDDQLPDDLRPTDDNPLAQPLEPGEATDVDLNEPSRSYAKEQEEATAAEDSSDTSESGESARD